MDSFNNIFISDINYQGIVLHICSVCHNQNPVLFPFMAYHRVCNESNMTGATSGAGTA